MKRRHVTAIAVLWVISLGAVAAVSAWSAQGQQVQQRPQETIPAPMSQTGDPMGPVISGADIGFQRVVPIQSDRPGEVSGRWMVRVAGEWKVAKPAVGIVKTP